MIRRPPRSTLDRSSAASDVYKRQGVVDWPRVIELIKPVARERDIILSVECGTIDQGIRSFEYLSKLL